MTLKLPFVIRRYLQTYGRSMAIRLFLVGPLLSAVLAGGFVPALAQTATSTETATSTSTPTATPTPTNTATSTATRTPTGTPILEDDYEDNDSSGTAAVLSMNTSTTELTFYPAGDEDWFQFDTKAGRYYQAETFPDAGLDTFLELYSEPNGAPAATNDDKDVGEFGSLIEWFSPGNATYYLRITNLDRTDPTGKNYTLDLFEYSPGPTATDVPLISGQADSYEPNYDFAHATLLAESALISANLVPWAGSDINAPDNDYYRVYVKPSLTISCETSNLGSNADTNMVLYEQGGAVLGGNDDIAVGNFASKVTTTVHFQGYVYVLIGQVGTVPPQETPNLTYDLECTFTVVTPTPVPAATPTLAPLPGGGPGGGVSPSATPVPPPTPVPSGTPAYLDVAALSTPSEPTREFPTVSTFDVLVYYDADGDRQFDSGEGVTGMPVEVHDFSLKVLLTRGLTDASGSLRLNGSAYGQFEIRLPYLGVRRVVPANPELIWVRIEALGLPSRLP